MGINAEGDVGKDTINTETQKLFRADEGLTRPGVWTGKMVELTHGFDQEAMIGHAREITQPKVDLYKKILDLVLEGEIPPQSQYEGQQSLHDETALNRADLNNPRARALLGNPSSDQINEYGRALDSIGQLIYHTRVGTLGEGDKSEKRGDPKALREYAATVVAAAQVGAEKERELKERDNSREYKLVVEKDLIGKYESWERRAKEEAVPPDQAVYTETTAQLDSDTLAIKTLIQDEFGKLLDPYNQKDLWTPEHRAQFDKTRTEVLGKFIPHKSIVWDNQVDDPALQHKLKAIVEAGVLEPKTTPSPQEQAITAEPVDPNQARLREVQQSIASLEEYGQGLNDTIARANQAIQEAEQVKATALTARSNAAEVHASLQAAGRQLEVTAHAIATKARLEQSTGSKLETVREALVLSPNMAELVLDPRADQALLELVSSPIRMSEALSTVYNLDEAQKRALGGQLEGLAKILGAAQQLPAEMRADLMKRPFDVFIDAIKNIVGQEKLQAGTNMISSTINNTTKADQEQTAIDDTLARAKAILPSLNPQPQ